ncbi:MAG TPA: hypothetical protein VH475_11060 [Tepidisphaeraceae bacterium]
MSRPAPGSSRVYQLVALLLGVWAIPALAQVQFSVKVEGLPDDAKALEPLISANVVAAARAWAERVEAKPCTIAILFRLDPAAQSGRGSGRSLRAVRLGNETFKDKLVSEQGWAARMRAGMPPDERKKSGGRDNDPPPDVEIVFEPHYFRTIWWDPEPTLRKRPVPNDKLDSMTVLLHELGHALAFNGWLDPRTGKVPGEFVSSYDRHVTFDGRDFHFTGPEAMKLWGGPVLLAHTNNNYHHVGDARAAAAGRESELSADLMNGVVFEYGRRYWIGRLDLAILADCGIHGRQKGTGAFGFPTSRASVEDHGTLIPYHASSPDTRREPPRR